MANTTPQTGYAPVNGLRMYYEIYGTGRPLVVPPGSGVMDRAEWLLAMVAAFLDAPLPEAATETPLVPYQKGGLM